MKYGLIGEHLGHSFSKEIHESLNDYEYDLKEIKPQDLDDFLLQANFNAINVTIPYKEKVIPYLYNISEVAKKIHSVNCIVNKDGKLYGDNTDYYGLEALLEYNNIEVKGKIVLILGTGGTSKTAKTLINDKEAKECYIVSRNKHDDILDYNDLVNFYDKDDIIIINATPCGMFPNNEDSIISIERFKKLYAYVDVIYNPLNTKTMVEALKNKNTIVCNGLYMLVAQAVFAHDIFIGNKTDKAIIDKIYNKILFNKQNIVLIGMPSSGKSTLGYKLSKALNRSFIDTDDLVKEKIKMNISDYITLYGEKRFREAETEVIKDIYKLTGYVISTGGGIIKKQDNIDYLKQNGKFYYLNRSLDFLTPTKNRPLSSSKEKLKKLYNERIPIYKEISDKIFDLDKEIDLIVEEMRKEYL